MTETRVATSETGVAAAEAGVAEPAAETGAPAPETRAAAPARKRFPKALLALPIAGVALGQRFVLPGTSIADLALALSMVVGFGYLVREVRATGWPRLPRWTRWLAALWAWAAAGGLVHVLSETETFSAAEFSKSLLKFTFYAVAVIIVMLAVRDAPPAAPPRMVLVAFTLAGIAAIALYVAMLQKVPLPYELLWGHGPDAAYFSDLWWFGGVHEARRVFLRAQGLSSEPSKLGYLQAMALAYLLLKRGPRVRFAYGLGLIVILLSLLLTFSLTAYAMLVPIGVLVLVDRWRSRSLRLGWKTAVAAVVVLLLIAPIASTVYSTVVVRATRALTGEGDTSSFLRVQGNWKMTYYLLETSPVVGVGLGNFDIVAWDLRAFIFQGYLIERETQGWNVLAYVLATTGLPGLLLLLCMLASAFRDHRRMALPFFLGMFADGTFLGAAYWVFLALFATDSDG